MNLFSTKKMTISRFLGTQKFLFFALLFVLILFAIGASKLTEFDGIDAVRSVPTVLKWMISNLLPDDKAIERLPKMLIKLRDTVSMSIMSSVTAAIFAFLFALLGSVTTRPHVVFSTFSRAFASVFRNIPIVAWAMIFLLSFGQSSFTGFLALFFASFGFLTRAFTEAIDEASIGSVEALRAVGASYPHLIVHAVIPSTLPLLISWVLYMIEVNIRSATLVGLLTGSGIGFVFNIYYKSLQYKSAALLIILIAAVVLLIEFISNTLRRKIL